LSYSETPEEVAARWRRENAENGRQDQRGAMFLSAEQMDDRTASSIRAQRKVAEIFGGKSAERWDEAYLGDVHGFKFEVQAVNPRWGVWWKDGWEDEADATIIFAFSQSGERCIGWTSIGELRKQPIDHDCLHPNRRMPCKMLRPPWFEQDWDQRSFL
jgi:hypothetical protein